MANSTLECSQKIREMLITPKINQIYSRNVPLAVKHEYV